MNKVILIGTSHPIQRNLNRQDFFVLINETIKKHNVVCICEEIDPVETVASTISKKMDLIYCVVEANREERLCLGIPDGAKVENDIISEHGYLDKEELDKRMQKVFRMRESEWLKRINKIQLSPILLICGSSHVEPFNKLLKKNGFHSIIENEEWE